MLQTYDKTNLNACAQNVYTKRPTTGTGEFQGTIVVDTSCLVRGVFLERIRSYETERTVLTTDRVAKETREMLRKVHYKKEITESEVRRAIAYVRQLYEKGQVIDVEREKTSPLLCFEYDAVNALSSVLSKSILEEVITDEFERIYRKAAYVQQEAAAVGATHKEAADYIVNEDDSFKDASKPTMGIRKCIRQMKKRVSEERRERLIALNERIEGEIAYDAFLEEVESNERAQDLCIKKVLQMMFRRIEDGIEAEEAKEQYEGRREEGKRTDQELVFASYAIVFPRQEGESPIGIASADSDIRELIALRKHTALNYRNADEVRVNVNES